MRQEDSITFSDDGQNIALVVRNPAILHVASQILDEEIDPGKLVKNSISHMFALHKI